MYQPGESIISEREVTKYVYFVKTGEFMFTMQNTINNINKYIESLDIGSKTYNLNSAKYIHNTDLKEFLNKEIKFNVMYYISNYIMLKQLYILCNLFINNF